MINLTHLAFVARVWVRMPPVKDFSVLVNTRSRMEDADPVHAIDGIIMCIR
jgi:hypothetical protein